MVVVVGGWYAGNCRDKSVFYAFVLVRPCQCNCKVTYLQQIFLPSVSRFLSDEVVVAASTQSDPLSTPAVTLCPYDESK